MSSYPQADRAGRLPQGPLSNATLPGRLRQKSTHGPDLEEMTPEVLAAVVFDEAVIAAGLSNKWIAATLGVSESMVGRWRKAYERECPSVLQLLKIREAQLREEPEIDFLRLVNRGFSRRCGWGRRALLDVVEGLGELAEAVNE